MEYVKQFYSADNLLGGPEGALATGFIEAMDDVVQGKAEMYYLAGFMKGIAEENNPDKKCGQDYGRVSITRRVLAVYVELLQANLCA